MPNRQMATADGTHGPSRLDGLSVATASDVRLRTSVGACALHDILWTVNPPWPW